jgi:hypothetical protein
MDDDRAALGVGDLAGRGHVGDDLPAVAASLAYTDLRSAAGRCMYWAETRS